MRGFLVRLAPVCLPICLPALRRGAPNGQHPQPSGDNALIRLTPDLAACILLTVLGLFTLADRFAPYAGLTEAGCRIGYVYDGDTVELVCGGTAETARLVGFDTPEVTSPRCPEEKALGLQATQRLRGLLMAMDIGISDLGFDKYQRRLVRVMVKGRDVAGIMVAEGLAVAYSGGTRIDWCARIRG